MKQIDDPAVRRQQLPHPGRRLDHLRRNRPAPAPTRSRSRRGTCEREWTDNGRRCFHYVMDRPILDFYATLSARYTVKRRSTTASSSRSTTSPSTPSRCRRCCRRRRTGSTTSAPTSRRICIASIASSSSREYQSFAQAFPNTIPYSEAIGFLYRKEEGDDKIDLAYFVTAHELAHQWWAHQVVGGDGQGVDDVLRGPRRVLGADGDGEALRSARRRRNSCAASSTATCGAAASSGRRKCRCSTSRTSRTSTTRRDRSPSMRCATTSAKRR